MSKLILVTALAFLAGAIAGVRLERAWWRAQPPRIEVREVPVVVEWRQDRWRAVGKDMLRRVR